MLSKSLFQNALLVASRPANNFLMMQTPLRFFSRASSYNGCNDMIRQEKRQAKKFGMKRHFYDKEKVDKSALPTSQYVPNPPC